MKEIVMPGESKLVFSDPAELDLCSRALSHVLKLGRPVNLFGTEHVGGYNSLVEKMAEGGSAETVELDTTEAGALVISLDELEKNALWRNYCHEQAVDGQEMATLREMRLALPSRDDKLWQKAYSVRSIDSTAKTGT